MNELYERETDYLTKKNQKWLCENPIKLDSVLKFRENINQVINDNIAYMDNVNFDNI